MEFKNIELKKEGYPDKLFIDFTAGERNFYLTIMKIQGIWKSAAIMHNSKKLAICPFCNEMNYGEFPCALEIEKTYQQLKKSG